MNQELISWQKRIERVSLSSGWKLLLIKREKPQAKAL